MAKKTLEQLQETHSEMLATAADLGMTVPVDLTADFASAETGGTVCSNLDALLRQFRSGIDGGDASDAKADKVVAADDVKSDDEMVKSSKKTAAKKTKTKPETKAAPAETGDNSGVEQVTKTAKKSAAKKPAAKKSVAKKASGKQAAGKKPATGGTRFAEDATIKWGAGKKNPAREGKGRHERIEKVMKSTGKTVKAFVASGGNPTTLRNCVNAKLCTVA